MFKPYNVKVFKNIHYEKPRKHIFNPIKKTVMVNELPFGHRTTFSFFHSSVHFPILPALIIAETLPIGLVHTDSLLVVVTKAIGEVLLFFHMDPKRVIDPFSTASAGHSGLGTIPL